MMTVLASFTSNFMVRSQVSLMNIDGVPNATDIERLGICVTA